MNPIVLAVIIVAAIGLLLGLMLAIASIVMAVPVDETAVAIEEVLAGANCGACGFSGCSGYASALSKGTCTDCTLCSRVDRMPLTASPKFWVLRLQKVYRRLPLFFVTAPMKTQNR